VEHDGAAANSGTWIQYVGVIVSKSCYSRFTWRQAVLDMTAGQFLGIQSRLRVILNFDDRSGTEGEPGVAKLRINKQGEGVKIDGAWRAAIIELRWSAEARCREQLKLLKCNRGSSLGLNLGIISTRLQNLASIFAACHLLFFRIPILRISELSLSHRLHSLAFTCTVSFVLRASSVTCPFEPCSPRLLTSAQQSPLRCPCRHGRLAGSRTGLIRREVIPRDPELPSGTYKLAPIAFDDQ
jgi:hypothetical protein